MDALDEIKNLYYNATRTTISRDLIRAVTLLKTMPTEEERERAAVYMDGLAQMRSEWAQASQGNVKREPAGPTVPRMSGAKGRIAARDSRQGKGRGPGSR